MPNPNLGRVDVLKQGIASDPDAKPIYPAAYRASLNAPEFEENEFDRMSTKRITERAQGKSDEG